jgi:hypothetical protein
MDHHDVFSAVAHHLAWLKEKFCLTSSDLLLSKLRLSIFADGIIDHAVLILLKDYNVDLLNQIFLGVDDMNVVD